MQICKKFILAVWQALKEAKLSSRIPDQDFRQMKSLTISNAENAWIHFQVLAVARYPGECPKTSRCLTFVVKLSNTPMCQWAYLELVVFQINRPGMEVSS